MALEILTPLDFIAILIESATFIAIIIYYLGPGTSVSKCRSIVVDENILGYWRISLYTQSLSVWLAAIYTFIFPSASRFLFHLTFYVTIIYMLNWVSLPTWVCKTKGYGGMCNCDFYGYHDLTPMLILSAIGGLIFAFIDLSASQSILMLALLTFFAIIVFFFLPEREVEPLKYPPELLIHSVDELQAFLLESPAEIKLITLLRDTCDFCVIQVDEIARVPKELIHSRLRIFDLSVHTMDPILALTLNLHDVDLSKMPVPSTRIYDQGMEIEIKDGVLSSPEIEQILTPF